MVIFTAFNRRHPYSGKKNSRLGIHYISATAVAHGLAALHEVSILDEFQIIMLDKITAKMALLSNK